MKAHDQQMLLAWVADVCGAPEASVEGRIQELWSGYGEILRVGLTGGPTERVVVKWVRPPDASSHPRGWTSDRSHQRKLRSYQVERTFYARYAARTNDPCRVPRCVGSTELDGGWAFVLEDLDDAGFSQRRSRLSGSALDAALRWLANFHATFLGEAPDGLWDTGTYWHLATRPDEWAATTEPRLRDAAGQLDRRLSAARFQTLVHGDAKVANLCFTPGKRPEVAAVDFQYVGGGCGMKDLAYLLSSCLSEGELLAHGDDAVDAYFGHLRAALAATPLDAAQLDAAQLEDEWRGLYPVAWADFARFLSGWAPGHWKLHGYARRMVDVALEGAEGAGPI